MSTHKHIDKICCVVLAVTLVITLLFINAEQFGVQKASTVMGYENAIFDKSKVHTIDIIMDNWDEFTADCKSEEYYNCTVVIDNEAYKNVAIRGKGNTSLSQVTNDRYSYKIEFDHYDSTNTYYGLDKLCLNNIIQDNTYMKDYLTYTMMYDMGVASPLCSYAYITVNGEDWGLYLAVEGIEESFLQRNYGKDYGELYKPDSMSMGGGRGNGDKFSMDDFLQNSDTSDESNQMQNNVPETTSASGEVAVPGDKESIPDTNTIPNGQMPEGQIPEEMTPPDFNGNNPFGNEMPEAMTPPSNNGSNNPFGEQMSENMGAFATEMSLSAETTQAPAQQSEQSEKSKNKFSDFSQSTQMPMPNDFNFSIDEDTLREAFKKAEIDESVLDGVDFDNITMETVQSVLSGIDEEKLSVLMQELGSDFSFGGEGNKGGFGGIGGMGSSDVKLQYTDDNADSYSNIFENAKTDITDADKERLIESLRKLSNYEDLKNTVDIEAVIRYFVIHNFVVNGDSYTGSMIHNYYLYEKDGQLQMIPWDYNLAFGGFQSIGGATSSVNDPIDTPLSVNGSGDRPMADWIFSNEEYTELYHKYFNDFISEYFDSGYFSEMIDSVSALISPYVEKDPTKFCTYEKFEKGVTTLKEFCLLRAESVKSQLDGTIGSTSETQTQESLVDADHINISDMGSMGMGGGQGGFTGNTQRPQENSVDTSSDNTSAEQASGETEQSDEAERNKFNNQIPDDFQNMTPPDFNNIDGNTDENAVSDKMQRPDNNSFTGEKTSVPNETDTDSSTFIMLGITFAVLVFGIIFALRFKRRKIK